MVAEINQFAGCLDNSEFFNEIALEIAEKYQAGELSYTVCDGLVNDLWRAMLDGLPKSGASVPEPFYSIYLAFDAGEYFHTKDRSDDPVADHTDPQIADILRGHFSSGLGKN
jgi:hypothetical protein